MSNCGCCGMDKDGTYFCRGKFVCRVCHQKAMASPCDRCGRVDPGGLGALRDLSKLLCRECLRRERTEASHGRRTR